MATYIKFWWRMIYFAGTGGRNYLLWMGFLSILVAVGLGFYLQQLTQGLIVTNLSDQVSWGCYIANFTFLVGVAAAAVLLVFPSYVFKDAEIKKVVLLGELLAVSAIAMCSLFIAVDLGRPDRFMHILPFLGRINFPQSILAWDVVVLNGYLLLNMYIPGYILYKHYMGKPTQDFFYMPFVYISIGWAVSIHTVTAFLYSGLGGRPFWNTAILAPRFLISAFASGPAILIIIFYVIRKINYYDIPDRVFLMLKKIISVTLPINFFFFGCEVFKELYTNSAHVVSAIYMFVGLHGHHMITPYIWSSIACNLLATIIFLVPKLRNQDHWLLIGSVAAIWGVWVEKGMGLLVPGQIPSPLGEIVEYIPSVNEFFVSLGIWAFGALLYTAMVRVAVAIETGKLSHKSVPG